MKNLSIHQRSLRISPHEAEQEFYRQVRAVLVLVLLLLLWFLLLVLVLLMLCKGFDSGCCTPNSSIFCSREV
jgi:hypothetical protein